MNLSESLKRKYTTDNVSAREAQRLAEFIAWGPVVFQASRLMVSLGILDMLRDSSNGLTIDEVAAKASLSTYAAKCLLEASLCIGTVIVDPETDRFSISRQDGFCSMILLHELISTLTTMLTTRGGFALRNR